MTMKSRSFGSEVLGIDYRAATEGTLPAMKLHGPPLGQPVADTGGDCSPSAEQQLSPRFFGGASLTSTKLDSDNEKTGVADDCRHIEAANTINLGSQMTWILGAGTSDSELTL